MKGWRSHRDERIFEALIFWGGKASARQIADITRMNVHSLPRTLFSVPNIRHLGGEAEESKWEII